MGKLTLHTGVAGSYYFFEEQLKNQDVNKFIYLLPVSRAVRYVKKKLVTNSKNKTLSDPFIFTFNEILQHLYHFFPQSKKIITATIRLILLEQVLRKSELEYFKTDRITGNALIKRIDKMISEFCQFGYRPQDFINPPVSASEKYFDFAKVLSHLFSNYSEKLIDENVLIREITESLDESTFRKVFPDVNKIYINGYGIYTPPMLNFIQKAKRWCDIEIKLEYMYKNPDLFFHTSDAFNALSKLATTIKENNENDFGLESNLFAFGNTDYAKLNLTNKIILRQARSKEDEVEFIATKIKRLYFEKNIALHQIGITFPNLETYVPLIRRKFAEFKIPFNLSTGFNLSQSPLVQSFLQTLKSAVSGFSAKEMLNLSLSPFISSELRADINQLNKIIILQRIKHFYGEWQEKLQTRVVFEKQKQNNQTFNNNPDEQTSTEQLIEKLSKMIQFLSAVNQPMTALEFRTSYLSLLKNFGMLFWYERENIYLNEKEKEMEFRAFNRFIKVFDQLIWTLNFIKGDRKFTPPELLQYLVLVTENATYNLREWSDYGVQVMPRLEIQSVESNILFVGGLVEGDFPRRFTHDIFFNDEERKQMGLNASEDLLSQDRFLFYQLIASSAQKVYLSYPAYKGDTELLPSTFLSSLQEICDVRNEKTSVTDNDDFSSKKFAEVIAGSLKNGINEAHFPLFSNWAAANDNKRVNVWMDNIESEFIRKSRLSISSFEGKLSEDQRIPALLNKKFGEQPLSITALENYAFCPMKFFYERILKIREDEEMEEIITPLEKGALVHKILFRFFMVLKMENKLSRPWESIQLLKQIAHEEFDKMPYEGMLWDLEQENYFGSESAPGLWDTFLKLEEEEIGRTGYIPAFFELSFGRSGYAGKRKSNFNGIPFKIKRKDVEVNLFGKIDRVDINNKGHFIVYDYKIGSSAENIKIKNIFEGDSLQLPVYILALKNNLQNNVAVAGSYYMVKDGVNCKRIVVFADKNNAALLTGSNVAKLPNSRFKLGEEQVTFDQLIRQSEDFVILYAKGIRNGDFRHTEYPQDDRCSSWCPFKKSCRKDVGKLIALKKTGTAKK